MGSGASRNETVWWANNFTQKQMWSTVDHQFKILYDFQGEKTFLNLNSNIEWP